MLGDAINIPERKLLTISFEVFAAKFILDLTWVVA
jgi:hypothetical protein